MAQQTATDPSFQLYGRAWGEKEYVLVLELYVERDGQILSETDPDVLRLSQEIGRTPAAVVMRMENFASVDPLSHGGRKGLNHAGSFCERVFGRLAHQREVLRESARVHRGQSLAEEGQGQLFLSSPVVQPRAFGKYELFDRIGGGDYCDVYSCVHGDTGATAAIKVINANGAYNNEAVHRFLREIRALRDIRHRNVIQLLEDNIDSERNFPAFVMELAATNLTNYLRANRSSDARPVLPSTEAACIVETICTAVEALHGHSRRIIHRDVNPNNVLRMDDGRWVLCDFGLAKFLGPPTAAATFATQTRQAGLGTAYYAAPEQYDDLKQTDERTDVWALGVLIWELFSSNGPPPDRSQSGLPPKLDAVYRSATQYHPKDRYNSVVEFREAFSAAIAET
jgi:serine/threonine protein kinase